MGSGNWSTSNYVSYTTSSKGYATLDSFISDANLNAQTLYKARRLSGVLDPRNVVRECRDSDEHPNTLPVILALDVTGSMGDASVRVSQKLNEIMTELYDNENIQDVEFCIMGIGDLICDSAPIQMSQFESDIRIAEQLDELYFEGGGGGNTYESYSAAWYMGVNHCKLDCWKRGKKGIIITLGDEGPNPYIPKVGRYGTFQSVVGDSVEADIDTKELLAEAREKFDIYHISIKDDDSSYEWHQSRYNIDAKWQELLGEDNYYVATLDNLSKTITNIIINREDGLFFIGNTGPYTIGADFAQVEGITW